MPKIQHRQGNKHQASFLLLPLALTFTFPSTSLVQAAEQKHVLEEVIVTARKQFDVVLDVPIAMTVMEGTQLAKSNTLRLEDMSASVPNLFVSETAIGNQLFIRGVGSGENKGFEQTVGTYIDGIYHGRGQLARIPFLDIQRVEVLKGPQGILFGKNTVAGALSVTTADPSEEVSSQVMGLYEVEHGEYRMDGAVSGALSENFTGRAAVRVSGMDGWMDNASKNKDEAGTKEKTARLSLGYSGFEEAEIIAKYTTGKFEVDGSNRQVGICAPGLAGVIVQNGLSDDCSTDEKRWANGTVVTGLDGVSQVDFSEESAETRYDTLAISTDWEIGDHTLSFITGYLSYDFQESTDNDYSELSFVMSQQDEEYHQVSQEIRFTYSGDDQFNVLTGLYWQQAELDLTRKDHVNVAQLGIPIAASNIEYFNQESNTLALFAQLQWFFNDEWSATLGGRISKENKDADKQLIHAHLGKTAPANIPAISELLQTVGYNEHDIKTDRSEKNFAPSLQVQWQPNVDFMAYASASKGFKGGGFDAALKNGSLDEFEYEKEKVTAFEIGVKQRLLDGRANLNIAVFSSEFSNVQVSTFDGTANFLVGNAGQLTTEGIEADGRLLITEGLEIGFAGTWLDSAYDKFPGAACYNGQTPAQGCDKDVTNPFDKGEQDLSGARTQYSPKVTFNTYLDYNFPVSDHLTFNVLAEVLYTDDYSVANDQDPSLEQKAVTKYNLRLGLSPSDNQWEVALIGKNLSDKKTINWGNDIPSIIGGSYYTSINRGFNVALQGSYNF